MAFRSIPPTVKGTSPAGLIGTCMSRGFSVGAANESFVSGGRGRNIHQQVGRKTIGDVAWQVEVIVPDFSVPRMKCNPPVKALMNLSEDLGRASILSPR
jgi:hypothetical protein